MARSTPKISSWQIIKGFFRLIRWQNLLIVVFTQLFTRLFLIVGEGTWQMQIIEKPLWLIIASTVLIAAAGYVINDYYDIKIDIINKPQHVIVGRYIKRRWALGINFSFNSLGVLLGLIFVVTVVRAPTQPWLTNWFHWDIAVELNAPKTIISTFSSVFSFHSNIHRVILLFYPFLKTLCLWVYSNQLKRLPFWGNLMVAFMTGLSLGVLAVYYKAHNREVFAYALFAFLITLIREIIKDMEDLRGDARHGCRTLPIVWGFKKTKQFLFGLMAIFAVLLFVEIPSFNQTLLVIFSLLLIPLGYVSYLLYRADTKKKFHQLSTLCKYFMLLGILSMALVGG